MLQLITLALLINVALQERLCSSSRHSGLPAAVRSLHGATTLHQPASIRIFEKLGFERQHCVEVWPPYPALTRYEKTIGFPERAAGDDSPGLAEFIPGGCFQRVR